MKDPGAADPPRLINAYAAYLRRVLDEADAGTVEIVTDGQPSGDAAIALVLGRRTRRWLWSVRKKFQLVPSHSGLLRTDEGGLLRFTVLDRWDARQREPVPTDFSVLAIVATFNEGDVIAGLINHLRSDAISVHVVDNWSTDETLTIVRRMAARDQGVTYEQYPPEGPPPYFELEQLLFRVEAIANGADADWIIHHDADEIRESPWSGISLRKGLYLVDAFGFNCVDHTVVNFRPIDNSWLGTSDLSRDFEWYEFGNAPGYFLQKKAWKSQPDRVSLAAMAGHEVVFSGRRVFPYKFVTRHYPIRSQIHGERKILRERQGRWSPDERARGWHTHYDAFTKTSRFIWVRTELSHVTSLRAHDLLTLLSGVGVPGNPRPDEGPMT